MDTAILSTWVRFIRASYLAHLSLVLFSPISTYFPNPPTEPSCFPVLFEEASVRVELLQSRSSRGRSKFGSRDSSSSQESKNMRSQAI